MNNPVPYPPYKVSLENLHPFSDHPDVATFQAALVRNMGVQDPGFISGFYDKQTDAAVRNFDLSALKAYQTKKVDTYVKLRTEDGTPNENFVRMVGLVIRND